MKTNKSDDISNIDLKTAALKLFSSFNKLPESAINPLMGGIFLLGMAATFFEPGLVAYLTMIFGASSGIAYAAAKNQTVHQLPTWAFPTVGVTAALIYAFAGVPGMILTAGLSGGWYVHSHYSDKFDQWKKDFHQFVENFKTNPVNQGVHVAFLGLQMLSNFIIKMEEPLPEQSEEELSLEESSEEQIEEIIEIEIEKRIVDAPEQQPEPEAVILDTTIEQAAEQLEQVQKQIQEQQAQEQATMPILEQTEEPQQQQTNPPAKKKPKTKTQDIIVPVPVLFSQDAPQQKTTASTTAKPKTTKIREVKPKVDTVLGVCGIPVIQAQRMQVRVDNSWIGLGRAFFRSLDPRVDLINEQGQNITQMAIKRPQAGL
jgi:hypothetical protein